MHKKIVIYTVDITQIGGIERSISNLVNLLCDENYEVEIVSLFKLNNIVELNIGQTRVTFLSNGPSDFINWNLIKSLFVYAKIFPKLIYNIYKNRESLVVSAYPSISLVLCLPFVNRIKGFAWEHSQLNAHSKTLNALRTRLYAKLSGVLTVVESQVLYYRKLNNNVYYFPNRIVKPNYEITKNIINFDNAIRIIFVGRLSKEKAPDRFIRIVRYFLDSGIPVKATIYGDGPLYPDCIGLARSLGLQDSIKFIKNQSDPREIYKDADFLLLTSLNESFGMVLLEAMAHSVIPIASIDGEGPRRLIIDFNNGILFDFNNLENLVSKLRSCDKKSIQSNMKTTIARYSDANLMKVIVEICRVD